MRTAADDSQQPDSVAAVNGGVPAAPPPSLHSPPPPPHSISTIALNLQASFINGDVYETRRNYSSGALSANCCNGNGTNAAAPGTAAKSKSLFAMAAKERKAARRADRNAVGKSQQIQVGFNRPGRAILE